MSAVETDAADAAERPAAPAEGRQPRHGAARDDRRGDRRRDPRDRRLLDRPERRERAQLGSLHEGQIPFAPPGIPQGLANAFAGTHRHRRDRGGDGLSRIGILVAIYLVEFAPRRVRNFVSLVLDVLMGIPAIVIGIFYYGLLVLTTHQQRALWGSIALATIMLPLVARSTIEVLAARAELAARGVARARAFRAGGRRSASSCRRPSAVIVTGASSPSRASPARRRRCCSSCSIGSNAVDWNPLHAARRASRSRSSA